MEDFISGLIQRQKSRYKQQRLSNIPFWIKSQSLVLTQTMAYRVFFLISIRYYNIFGNYKCLYYETFHIVNNIL
jgi:hypothetical protein